MMLPVLSAVLLLETALGLMLVSKVPPLEKLACMMMDLTQTARGSAVTKTLAGTLFIFMASSVSTYTTVKSSVLREHREYGHVDQSETFLLRTAELESALSGFIMLMALMINRVHYYLRGKRGLTLQLEVLKKQSKSAETEYLRLKEEKNQSSATDASDAEIKSLKEVIADLRGKVEQLQKDLQTKDKEAKAAEGNAQAIRKQSEGMALEYERLLEDNENLRTQVSSFDRQHSRSASKKDT
ncbi:unnamed protein product [Calypogeia fissa]